MILLFIWGVGAFDYSLIINILKYLPGDIYKNFIIVSIGDMILVLISGYFYHKTSIRWSLFAGFVVSAIGSISLMLLGE